MEFDEFKEKMIRQSKQIKIEISDLELMKFYNYMQELKKWNEKINLTAITEPEEIIQKHFMDSLTIQEYIKDNTNLVDVGTGAGFPGLPIKIIRDSVKVTLVDSLNKRLMFLEEIIKKLELSGIQSVHSRAEDIGKDFAYREKFDIAVSRAVASLSILVEYLLPLVKVDGTMIAMKASNVQDEIESAQNAITLLGGKIVKVNKIYLPNSEIERNIIIIQKEKNTPYQYPRKAGMPSKQPLK